MSPTLLAFDTSTEALALALAAPRGEFHRQLAGGAAASAALLPGIGQLLQDAGCTLAEVDAVAFGRGPGAFTGLRTSCAVAQGLALGLGRPALPIDSLLIVAEEARAQSGDEASFEVGVAVDARMGEVYAARYRWQRHWQTIEAPALCGPAELVARWAPAPPGWLAGSGLALLGVALPQSRRAGPERGRAAALLALARQAWSAGAGVDAAEALPLYLRDKVALTSAERMPAPAA